MASSTKITLAAFALTDGSPLTGLEATISWTTFENVADGSTRTPQPTFTEIGGGQYTFDHGLSAGEAFAGIVDLGATANPRYIHVTARYEDFIPATTSDVPSAASVASQVRTELTTELGRIDVATSTRLASASYSAPPSADSIANQVWDELLADHVIDDTFGAKLYYAPTIGAGAETVTLTITAGGEARQGVVVTIWSGATKTAQATTNNAGKVTFNLDAGTYSAIPFLVGYHWDATSITVSTSDTVGPSTIDGDALTSHLVTRTGVSGSCSLTSPAFDGEIANIVQGEDVTLTRTCYGVTDGTTISSAKLYVGDADKAQWTVTTSSGISGTVSDTGADGTGAFTFALTPTNTRSARSGVSYDYKIVVVLSDSKTYVAERGKFRVLPG